jgi:cell division control protein 6
MGFAVSRTGSKGRYGYGTEYKLTVSPYMVGYAYDFNWFAELQKEKGNHEAGLNLERADKIRKKGRFSRDAEERSQEVLRDKLAKEAWDNFVGLKE